MFRSREPKRSRRSNSHSQEVAAAFVERLDSRLLLSASTSGEPGFLFNAGGFLTGPSSAAPSEIAIQVVRARAAELGVSSADLAHLRVASSSASRQSGVTNVYLVQQADGVDVPGATANVSVAPDGRVLGIGHRLTANLANRPPARNLSLTDTNSSAFGGPAGGALATSFAAMNAGATSSVAATSFSGVPGSGTFNVFPLPLSAPHDGHRELVVDPADPTASPFGWQDLQGGQSPTTIGNNAWVYENRDGDPQTPGVQVDAGPNLNFNFPLNLDADVAANLPAALTQTYYALNMAHDIFYQYGFDEASGNFQFDNYGRGGADQDPVIAFIQQGTLTNVASITTPPDGQSPLLVLSPFTPAGEIRDAALDNSAIIHEYAIAMARRLTGGPSNTNSLDAFQSSVMAEGWGDFFALMLTQRPGDRRDEGFGIAPYLTGETAEGRGTRLNPYSFSFDVNGITLITYNNKVQPAGYHPGMIWASALWDLNWLLIDRLGFDSNLYNGVNSPGGLDLGGNAYCLQLVIEALKLQPANPTFTQARDAILLADQALSGGLCQNEIWEAFARRGLGIDANVFHADYGDTEDESNVVVSFTAPALSRGALQIDDKVYYDGDVMQISVSDLDRAGLGFVSVLVTASNDEDTVILAETSPGKFRGSLAVANGSGPIQDDLLQFTPGAVISVRYIDENNGTGASQQVFKYASGGETQSVFLADFSDASGNPFDEGFTFDNFYAGGSGEGLWHLSTGRGNQPGHSADDSFYYGSGEGTNGGGTYGPSSAGNLDSPVIHIPDAQGALLRFNSFFNAEFGFDPAQILISTNGIAYVPLVPFTKIPVTTGWTKFEFDVSKYVGQDVQFRFRMTSDASTAGEGWYIDDVEVLTTTFDFASLRGIVYDDRNGNGVRNIGDRGIAGQVVYLDENRNGVLDQNLHTQTFVAPQMPVPIPDLATIESTLTVSGLAALTDVNVTLQIDHDFGADYEIFLISPQGTRAQLVSGLAAFNGFEGTTFDDETPHSIRSVDFHYVTAGTFRPQEMLRLFDGENPNGVWRLRVRDRLATRAGVLNSWSLQLSTGHDEPTRITDQDGLFRFANLPSSRSLNDLTNDDYLVRLANPAAASGPPGGLASVELPLNGSPLLELGVTALSQAPTLGGITGPLSYTENAAAQLLAPNGTAADVDSLNLAGGLLRVALTGALASDRLRIRNQGTAPGQIGLFGNQVRFGGTVIGTFRGGQDGAPLQIAFNSAATPENVQALLRNILYQNLGNDPTRLGRSPSRTVEYFLMDGAGGGASAAQTLNITAVNDAPVLSGIGPVGYTEGSAPFFLAPQAADADADSANFSGGKLTLQMTAGGLATDRLAVRGQISGLGNLAVGGNLIYFNFVLIGTSAGGTGTTPLTITLNANATPRAVKLLLRSIAFENVSANPTNSGANPSRTLKYVLTDGDGGTSVAVNQTLNITAVNDKPVLAAIPSPQTYKENGAAKLLAPQATVADVDSANFGGGRLAVKYTAGGLGSDRLTIRHQGSGAGQVGVSGDTLSVGGVVVGTFTGGTGLQPLIITFNADAKLLRVQAVLRNISYQNISDNPTNFGANPSRTVNYVLTDGDGGTSVAVNQTLNITAVNDATLVGDFTDASTYTAGAGATILDANATVTDADSVDFAGGNLVLMFSTGGVATNRLAIRNQGTGANQIGVSGNNVTFAGTVIGTLNANAGVGLNALIVTFTPAATPAAVQALLRNLTYQSTVANPTGPKTLTLKVRDGDGGLTTVNKTLNITPALTGTAKSSAAFASYTDWHARL